MFKKLLPLVFGSLLILGLGACETTEEVPPDTDVTLKGSLTAPTTTALRNGLINAQTASLDPTDYRLYCVTFTEEPESGTGEFDADGAFEVLITNAAGLPIGCFINDKATNQPVATLSFIVGQADGLDDGTTTAASLEGGAYEMTINFDPVTGTATTDFTAVAQAGDIVTAPADSGLDPAEMIGAWDITCASTEAKAKANCEKFLYENPDGSSSNPATALPIYIDIISAEEAGNKLYAMGVWASKAAFEAAGATEGLNKSTIPADVENLVSLNTEVKGATATGVFKGFQTDAGAQLTFNAANNTYEITGADLIALLKSYGIAYDGSHNDQWVPQGETDWCPNTPDWPEDQSNGQNRNCLIGFLWEISEKEEHGIPRPSQDNWRNYSDLYDADGNPIPFDASKHKIAFEASSIGGSLMIGSRYALMGTEVYKTSVVARDYWEYDYQKWDETNNTSTECTASEELSINMIPISATEANGRFTMKGFDSCENEDFYASFETKFNK